MKPSLVHLLRAAALGAAPVGLPVRCLLLALACLSTTFAAPALTGDVIPAQGGDLVVHPINHATLALQAGGRTIYVDPVGGAARFSGLPRPDLILITDIHPDHLDVATLQAIATDKTPLVVSPAVSEKLPAAFRPRTTALANGQTNTVLGVAIEAVAAYNTTPDRL